MATFLVRMTIYDPQIMAALESLKCSRKQSAFLVEALRQFLSTEGGVNLLQSMTGTTKAERVVPSRKEISQSSIHNSSSRTNLDDIFRK